MKILGVQKLRYVRPPIESRLPGHASKNLAADDEEI